MQSGFETQIRTELRSEINSLEKDYAIIKDVLSGAKYDVSDIKGTLQSFKDHLSTVRSLFLVLSQPEGTQKLNIPIDSIVKQIDFALTLMALYPQDNPSGFLQLSLSLSHTRIEYIMSLISILKKTV